ncbi:hypothetical protein V8D89_002959 [Ganoderma adspersum]
MPYGHFILSFRRLGSSTAATSYDGAEPRPRELTRSHAYGRTGAAQTRDSKTKSGIEELLGNVLGQGVMERLMALVQDGILEEIDAIVRDEVARQRPTFIPQNLQDELQEQQRQLEEVQRALHDFQRANSTLCSDRLHEKI